jgi:hypothetical protein
MTPPRDLRVRQFEPSDREFLAWAVRHRSRRGASPFESDDAAEARERADVRTLEERASDPASILLIAEWRGERVGFATEGPSQRWNGPDRAGDPAVDSRDVYVDSWYEGLGIETALREAVHLGCMARRRSGVGYSSPISTQALRAASPVAGSTFGRTRGSSPTRAGQ